MWNESPRAFVDELKKIPSRRAYLVRTETGDLRGSHPQLEDLAAAVRDSPSFANHEGCFFEIGATSDHLLSAHVHRTTRGQGAGGVRLWSYPTLGAFIEDGLRLSRAMGHKNALAGLWWGGGKGVIARDPDRDHHDEQLRRAVYRDYGRFISSLRGVYVTAEDVGTTPRDMLEVHAATRYTTCISPALGGSGNPSRLTARGVVVAMEAALHHLGRGTLAKKRIAMQGLGQVARFMIEELLARGVASVVGVDIDPLALAEASQLGSERVALREVDPSDQSVFSEACDVFAPNAVGGTIGPQTIPALGAPIVCGAANNQLVDPVRDARELADRGVLYVPDFVANRMGIVNCADEQYGWFPGDPVIESHLKRDNPAGIYQRCLEIFGRSAKSGRSTAEEAEMLAEQLAAQQHPLWPGRGRAIIDHLIDSGWERGFGSDEHRGAD